MALLLAVHMALGGLAACGAMELAPQSPKSSTDSEVLAIRPAASTGVGEPGAKALDAKAIVESRFPLVLMYHDIMAGAPSADDVSPENFVAQLNWLQSQNYKTISIDQYFAYKSGKITKAQLPTNPVLLTFDDGYKGVVNVASKELAKRQFQATLFVHTGFVGSPTGRPKMTWADYNSLESQTDSQGKPLFRVYSHTVSHPVAPNGLASLSLANLQKELKDSKAALETHLELKVPRHYIAWPQGNYDTQVVAEAHQAGYVGAFAVGSPKAQLKVNGLKQPLLFQLGRMGVGKSISSVSGFAARVQAWKTGK